MATFSYFGYLCGYLPISGLDTQELILATKVSNLRNKSHLYSKMTTLSKFYSHRSTNRFVRTNGQAESNMLPTFLKLGAQ